MKTTSDYGFDIHTLLVDTQPNSILIIGRGGELLVADYIEQRRFLKKPCRVEIVQNSNPLLQLRALGRFDTGVVINAIEQLDKEIAEQLIASLRDVHTSRFCVVVPIGDAWDDHRSKWEANELISLGLSLVNKYEQNERILHLYKFDVATYKNTPKWLNAEKWANPQLWDKYRW